jgi:hypothetical protein
MSKEFTEAQQEAIATADAHLGNADLPTYAQLRAALELAHEALFDEEGDGDLHLRAVLAIDAALDE